MLCKKGVLLVPAFLFLTLLLNTVRKEPEGRSAMSPRVGVLTCNYRVQQAIAVGRCSQNQVFHCDIPLLSKVYNAFQCGPKNGRWTGSGHEAACVTWTRDCCGCSSCVQKAWWECEPRLESTTRQRRMTSLLKGTPFRAPMGWSSRMVATTLPVVAEAAKDCRVLIWNVRNEHETSDWFRFCVGMVIAILTVLSGGLSANPISDD